MARALPNSVQPRCMRCKTVLRACCWFLRVLADKAYAAKANRASLHGKHRDGIMRKAARNRPLRASEKRFNKLISKRRFRVEQCFGTMKRLFGLHRARYFGVAKTHAQMAMAAIGQNLLKAANKITLNPQTPAIV